MKTYNTKNDYESDSSQYGFINEFHLDDYSVDRVNYDSVEIIYDNNLTYEEYSEFHNDIEEKEFPLYGTKASIELDKQTTGLDGYKKLKNALRMKVNVNYVYKDNYKLLKIWVLNLFYLVL